MHACVHTTQVLVKLEYIDAQNAVQLKGRVASEVNTCDELILTELVFENVRACVRGCGCVCVCGCAWTHVPVRVVCCVRCVLSRCVVRACVRMNVL